MSYPYDAYGHGQQGYSQQHHQQQHAQYATQYQDPYPAPLSHNPYGDVPLIPQPVVRRLPQPIPAHQLEPPPVDRESDAYGHGRSSASRHRDRTESITDNGTRSKSRSRTESSSREHRSKSRSRTESAHSSSRTAQQPPPMPMPPMPTQYTQYHSSRGYADSKAKPLRTRTQVAEVHYHEDMTAAEFEATIGGYVEKGYLKATNEQLGASGYDYEQQPVDTPIIGGLAALREREVLKDVKAFRRRSRSVGDFASYSTSNGAKVSQWSVNVSQYQYPIPNPQVPLYANPQAARSTATIASTKSSKSKSKSKTHAQPAPPVPRLPKVRSRQHLPTALDLNGSNGKTETQNTFSGGLVIGDDNESDFRYDWNQDFNDPAVRDPETGQRWPHVAHGPRVNMYNPYAPTSKPSIYANPRMAASSASFYASGHSQGRTGENAPPVPQLPVGYHQQKRPGFFKRLIGRV